MGWQQRGIVIAQGLIGSRPKNLTKGDAMRQPFKNIFRAGMVALAVVAAAGYSTTGSAETGSGSTDASQLVAQAPLAAQKELERVIVNEISSRAAKLDASQIEAKASLAAQKELERVIVNEISSRAAKLGNEPVDASQIETSPAIQEEVRRVVREILETGWAVSN